MSHICTSVLALLNSLSLDRSKLKYLVKGLIKIWEGFEQTEATIDQETDPKVTVMLVCLFVSAWIHLCAYVLIFRRANMF